MEDTKPEFPPRHENQNLINHFKESAALYYTDNQGTRRFKNPPVRGKAAKKRWKKERLKQRLATERLERNARTIKTGTSASSN